MKKLAIIGIIVGMASLSFAQEIKLGGNLGYFMAGDSKVKDTYGKSGIILGGLVRYSVAPQIDVVGGIDYYKLSETGKYPSWTGTSTGTSTTVELKPYMRVIPITVSCLYNIPIQPNILGYVGGGIGMYMAKRNAPSTTGATMTTTSSLKEESKSPFGFQVLGGFDYLVSPNISINAQVKYAYAKVKDWADTNVGGISITAGVVYNLVSSKKE